MEASTDQSVQTQGQIRRTGPEVNPQVAKFFEKFYSLTKNNQMTRYQSLRWLTIILGKTGAGKSSFFNLYTGHALEAERRALNWAFSGRDLPAEIGNGMRAQTVIPNYFQDKGKMLVDFQGFLDTEGAIMDIASAFNLKDLICSSTEFRIVLTLEIDFFKSRRKDLVDMVSHVSELFENTNSLLNSLFVVVTKAPAGVDVGTIQEVFDEVVREEEAMAHHKESTLTILKTLRDDPNKIGIFYEPTKGGPIDIEHVRNIVDKLRNISYTQDKAVRLSFSDSAKVLLQEILVKLQKELRKEIAKMINKVKELCESHLSNSPWVEALNFAKTVVTDLTSYEEAENGSGSFDSITQLAEKVKGYACMNVDPFNDYILKTLVKYIQWCDQPDQVFQGQVDALQLEFETLLGEILGRFTKEIQEKVDLQVRNIVEKTQKACEREIQQSVSFQNLKEFFDRLTNQIRSQEEAHDELSYLSSILELTSHINPYVCQEIDENVIQETIEFMKWARTKNLVFGVRTDGWRGEFNSLQRMTLDLLQTVLTRRKEQLKTQIERMLAKIKESYEGHIRNSSWVEMINFTRNALTDLIAYEREDGVSGSFDSLIKLAGKVTHYICVNVEPFNDSVLRRTVAYISSSSQSDHGFYTEVVVLRPQFKDLIDEIMIRSVQAIDKKMYHEVLNIVEKVQETCQRQISDSFAYQILINFLTRLIDKIGVQMETHDRMGYLQRILGLTRHINFYQALPPINENGIRESFNFIRWAITENLICPINAYFWRRELNSLREAIQNLIKPVALEPKNDTLKIFGTIISFSTVEQLLTNPNFKNIEIYCLGVIFIDISFVNCKGKNLSIISPLWKITRECLIDLSGQDIVPRPPSGQHDGLPGQPGNNGGDFFGYGLRSDSGAELTIKSNGSKGGRGEDGQDGDKGEPGKDGNRALVNARDETCLITRKPDLRPGSILKDCLTFNGGIIEVFESKGEPGKQGKTGGKAGAGGRGGYKGRVRITEVQVQTETNDGAKGDSGVRGRGGPGGEGGVTYEGIFKEEYILPELRGKYNNLRLDDSEAAGLGASRVGSGVMKVVPHVGVHFVLPIIPIVLSVGQAVVSGILAIHNTCWKKEACKKVIGIDARGEKVFERAATGEPGMKAYEENEEGIESPIQNAFAFEEDQLRTNYNRYYMETIADANVGFAITNMNV